MKIRNSESRPYRQSKRADAAEQTLQSILQTGLRYFGSRNYEAVRLDDIAADCGITVQTVLRRLGSKEKLFLACAERMGEEITAQRGAAPINDLPGFIDNLVEHYEQWGETVLRMLMQEDSVPVLAEVMAGGRKMHRDWLIKHLPTYLTGPEGQELQSVNNKRRIAQLVAITDVYTWRLLRRQAGLSRAQTAKAMQELIEALPARR